MIKPKYLIILSLLVLALSCVSGPLDAPTSPDQCLVIIRTESHIPVSHASARTTFFEVPTVGAQCSFPRVSSGYMHFVINSDDDNIESIVSKVTHPDYYGDDYESEWLIDLPYKEGGIAIANFKIIFVVKEEDDENLSSGWALEAINAEEYQKAMNYVNTNPKFVNWVNE